MSANLGAADSERLKIGFGDQDNGAVVDAEIKRFFSPEFRNRLDAVVKFNKLTMVEMGMIVNSEVDKCQAMLLDKGVTLSVTAVARAHLAQVGYDPKMGARPFERLFEDRVKRPLSKELLFGGLADGGEAVVDLVDGEITVVSSVPSLIGAVA